MAIFKDAQNENQLENENQLLLPGMGLEVPEDFKKLESYINWDKLSYKERLSEDFIRRYFKYFAKNNALETLGKTQKLSPNFIREFPVDEFIKSVNSVDFPKEFVEEILAKYPDKFSWFRESSKLANNGLLTFDWIKKHKNKPLSWREIVQKIELSDQVANFLFDITNEWGWMQNNPTYKTNVSEEWKTEHDWYIRRFNYNHRW
jgi:hypothetical protein